MDTNLQHPLVSLNTESAQTDSSKTINGARAPLKKDTDLVEQSPTHTPESSQPQRSWKSIWACFKLHYDMPSQMVILFLLGLFGALGHHLYYQGLHGQEVQDTEWPVRFGTALSFFVKICLVGSVEIAYKQQAWLIVKTRTFKISTLDVIFSVCSSPFGFAHPEFLFEAFIAAVIAGLVWILPLCAIASPSTLTIQDGDRIRTTTCNVSMIDFTRENGFGLDSDDQDRAGMSYWDTYGSPGAREDGIYTYASPSSELRRIFQLSTLTYTGPISPPTPCPSAKACTYPLNLSTPVYHCEQRQEFGGENLLGYNKSQLVPTGPVSYASYSSINEDIGGKPFAWKNMTPSTQELGVFTEIPTLWVGWVTKSSGYHSSIAECTLYDAVTTYNVTFFGSNQAAMHQTAISLVNPLLPNGSSKAPWEEDYQQFSAYHAAAYMFRSFLSGNITSDPLAGFIDRTDLIQTNLFDNANGYFLYDDLSEALGELFQHFWLSTISDSRLHSQINRSTLCDITESVLLWQYNPFWLALSYLVAIGLTIVVVLIGSYCFYKNGYSMDITFSTFVATSRSPDLDKLVEGHYLGHQPKSRDILDAKLKFGELVIPSNQLPLGERRAAFAFPNNVKRINSSKEFLSK